MDNTSLKQLDIKVNRNIRSSAVVYRFTRKSHTKPQMLGSPRLADQGRFYGHVKNVKTTKMCERSRKHPALAND